MNATNNEQQCFTHRQESLIKQMIHHIQHSLQHDGAALFAEYRSKHGRMDVKELQCPGTRQQEIELHRALSIEHLNAAKFAHQRCGNLVDFNTVYSDVKQSYGQSVTAPDEFTPPPK